MNTIFEIHVEQGLATGTRVTFDDEVSRLGSHPNMALCIPGLPSHAITLVRRGDEVFVINRACRELVADGFPIPIGQQARWDQAAPLVIDRTSILRLCARAVDTDLPLNKSAFEDEHAARLESQFRPEVKYLGKLALAIVIVIVCCICVAAYRHSFTDAQRVREYLSEMFREFQDVPLDNLRMRKAERLLRKAGLEELSPDPEIRRQGRSTYLELRKLLNEPQTSPSGTSHADAALKRDVLKYVEYRLRCLRL